MRRSPNTILVLVAASCAIAHVAPGQIRDERRYETLIAPAASTGPELQLDLERVEELIRQRLNRFRSRRELSRLPVDERLAQTADDFAAFMAEHNEYGHQADGRQPSERVAAHGYEFCLVLENIGWSMKSTGFTPSELARQFHRGWKESPGHRKNMLDPDVTEMGVGTAHSAESGRYYAVQLFGRPKSRQIVFRVENRAAEAVSYAVDSQKFSLDPGYIRKHAMCRPPKIAFFHDHAEGDQGSPEKEIYRIQSGDRFIIQRTDPAVEIVRIPREQTADETD